MARKVSIPRAAIKKIYEAVDAVFDRAIARFLNKPLPGDKRLEFKLSTTLPSLFAAAANEERTEPDKSTLATLLEIAEGFVNSQRHATKAHVVKSVESWLNSANQEGVDTDLETVLGGELGGVFQKATDGMQKIVATESNTAKNVGGLTGITLVNAASGIEDPVVYFVVVRDDSCCDECKRLHLLDDELTPRLWYLSEVGHGYHKKGDSNPKMSGLHPHCRCTLATLLPGFGFEGGSPTFVSTGHKEIEVQRDLDKKEPVWGPEALRKSTPRGERHFHDNRERYDTNGKYLDKGPHLDSWLEHVNKHTGKSGEEAYQHLLTAPISVSFSTNRIGKIDNDGRLKNVFETDESMGAGTHNVSQLDPYYLKVRRDTEHSLFGIPHDASGEERPVYGSVMASWNTGNRPMNYGYGNAHLVLKQHVKNRTTFTPDDSLGLSDYWKGDVGESVCSASHLPTLLSHVPVPATREAKFMPGISGDPYVEAQIHGGVDLNHDVESIHVNDFARSPVDEHTAKKVVDLGRKYKLPVYKHRNDGTSETLYHPDWGAGATEANPLHAPEPSPAVKKAEVVVQTLDDFKLFKSERPKGVFLNFKSQEANLVPIVVKSVEEVCKDGHVFTDDRQAFKIFVKNKEQAERVVGLIQNKILGE